MSFSFNKFLGRLNSAGKAISKVNNVSQTIISTLTGMRAVSGDARLVKLYEKSLDIIESLKLQKEQLLKDIKKLRDELSEYKKAEFYMINTLKTKYPEAYKGVIAGIEEIQETDEEE